MADSRSGIALPLSSLREGTGQHAIAGVTADSIETDFEGMTPMRKARSCMFDSRTCVIFAIVLVLSLAVGIGVGVAIGSTQGSSKPSSGTSNNSGSQPEINSQVNVMPFFPNTMYDCSPPSASKNQQRLHLQSAGFTTLSFMSQRVYQTERLWCGSSWKNSSGVKITNRRSYSFGQFVAHGTALIDLFTALQLTDCQEPLLRLRAVLVDSLVDPSSWSSSDKLNPGKTWWTEQYFPAAVEAFSCGFTADEAVNPARLPSDISPRYTVDQMLQKVWRLTRTHLQSHQKLRENAKRQFDFDVGMYIPFLHPSTPSAPDYLAAGEMRVGFPTGLSVVWKLWHTIAARTKQVEEVCGNLETARIITRFADLLTFFGPGHPCPYCRDHFMSRVSRNDRSWQQLAIAPGGKWVNYSEVRPTVFVFPLFGCNVCLF